MKKKVGTLLAVTLVAAAPAVVAGPMHAHHGKEASKTQGSTVDGSKVAAASDKPDPWAGTSPSVTPFPPNMPDSFRRMQAQMIVDGMFATFGVTTPRVLRSGAPACGNVQTKSPHPRPCTEDE